MADACRRAVAEGFDTIAFGDLFLTDVRAIASGNWPAPALRRSFRCGRCPPRNWRAT